MSDLILALILTAASLFTPAVENVSTSEGTSVLTTSMPATISGPATWYDAPTIRDAAAGPALRKALGPGWRDTTVQVCAAGYCIETVLSDWCACGHGHLIDLDDQAFAELAPLSRGIVRVMVSWAGGPAPRPTPPPTDVGP